jgi:hypothetical protein
MIRSTQNVMSPHSVDCLRSSVYHLWGDSAFFIQCALANRMERRPEMNKFENQDFIYCCRLRALLEHRAPAIQLHHGPNAGGQYNFNIGA